MYSSFENSRANSYMIISDDPRNPIITMGVNQFRSRINTITWLNPTNIVFKECQFDMSIDDFKALAKELFQKPIINVKVEITGPNKSEQLMALCEIFTSTRYVQSIIFDAYPINDQDLNSAVQKLSNARPDMRVTAQARYNSFADALSSLPPNASLPDKPLLTPISFDIQNPYTVPRGQTRRVQPLMGNRNQNPNQN